MDLLSGLRKGDSSRGGRAEFKWEDVKEDKDRENYLGHSLMARMSRTSSFLPTFLFSGRSPSLSIIRVPRV